MLPSGGMSPCPARRMQMPPGGAAPRAPRAPRVMPDGAASLAGMTTVRRTAPAMRAAVAYAVAAVVAGGTVAALAGCGSLGKGLGSQQVVVSFQDGASNAARLAVRAACGRLPNVSAAPLPAGVPLSASLSQVIYNVDHASPADDARLQVCLSRYPSVVAGLNFQDSTDEGS
jgi:hypothetical protein